LRSAWHQPVCGNIKQISGGIAHRGASRVLYRKANGLRQIVGDDFPIADRRQMLEYGYVEIMSDRMCMTIKHYKVAQATVLAAKFFGRRVVAARAKAVLAVSEA
jgi:hypothetical protein